MQLGTAATAWLTDSRTAPFACREQRSSGSGLATTARSCARSAERFGVARSDSTCATAASQRVTVLNHALYELTKRGDFEELVPHAADRQAIHNLIAVLERDDAVVLSPDYAERLDQARQSLLPDVG